MEHQRIVDEAAQRFGNHDHERQPAGRRRPVYRGGDQRLQTQARADPCRHRLRRPIVTTTPAYYAAHVFANAVGGGMSSRLFQEVREQRGLAYAIYSFHWAYADTGLFGFYAATAPRDVAELMPVALDCLGQAAQDLSEAELDAPRRR